MAGKAQENREARERWVLKVTITASGSAGDVEPCIAVGRGLQQAGHQVLVATWVNFEGSVRRAGLSFHPVDGPEPDEVMAPLLEAGAHPGQFIRSIRQLSTNVLKRGYEDWVEACLDADAVLYNSPNVLGYAIADSLGIPSVGVSAEPVFCRNGLFPGCMMGGSPGVSQLSEVPGLGNLYNLYNRLSYWMSERVYWWTMRPFVEDLDAKTKHRLFPKGNPLKQIAKQREPTLCGWSPSVLPEPPEWSGWNHTTGYLFLDHDYWTPPEELTRFLEAGPPPVAVGLGSATNLGAQTLEAASRALKTRGMRGVIVAGKGHTLAQPVDTLEDLEDLEDGDGDVLVLKDFVPYRWLFERSAAAVHHGGAGTSAAALWAGIPSIVVPSIPDQAFWSWRLSILGVSPEAIPYRELTARRLADAVGETISNVVMGEQASQIGREVRAEDGVKRAVEHFLNHVESGTESSAV